MPIHSDAFMCNYMHILEVIKERCAESFTHKELATFLEVSRRTIGKFMQGELIRVDLLEQIAGMVGYNLELSL